MSKKVLIKKTKMILAKNHKVIFHLLGFSILLFMVSLLTPLNTLLCILLLVVNYFSVEYNLEVSGLTKTFNTILLDRDQKKEDK